MKKTVITISAVAVMAVAAVCAYCTVKANENPFLNANVEALAGVESGFFGDCHNISGDCVWVCPGCSEPSYIDKKGPIKYVKGACVKCGYALPK